MIRDRTSLIMKGPSLLGVNFRLVTFRFRFRASNHTFSPFLNGVKCYLVLAAIVCLVSSCVASVMVFLCFHFFPCNTYYVNVS